MIQIIGSKTHEGTCEYCDRPSITLRPATVRSVQLWCADCRNAQRVGGADNQSRMVELLDRIEAATQAGLRADDLEVALAVQEWQEMKAGAR